MPDGCLDIVYSREMGLRAISKIISMLLAAIAVAMIGRGLVGYIREVFLPAGT